VLSTYYDFILIFGEVSKSKYRLNVEFDTNFSFFNSLSDNGVCDPFLTEIKYNLENTRYFRISQLRSYIVCTGTRYTCVLIFLELY